MFGIVYAAVTLTSLFVCIVLFVLFEVNLKPASYLLLVVVIAFTEGELVKFFFRKEMLFFRVHVEYKKGKISLQYERILYLIMDIAIIVLLVFYIFFNDLFYLVISPLSKDKVRGGILTVLLVGLIGSLAFWTQYFVLKWIRSRR